ncbi:hypothetical protein C9J27_03090 [Photobacterium kishitanii]|uniref:Uncharacterized protein n=2 Tax=Photobacterium kishitanii TaxID=318456 RepID=A0A2T3KML2_9GAMM|nr:hypothetical protein C9J27_03090 [Photobacterium kishitanii]
MVCHFYKENSPQEFQLFKDENWIVADLSERGVNKFKKAPIVAFIYIDKLKGSISIKDAERLFAFILKDVLTTFKKTSLKKILKQGYSNEYATDQDILILS